eukprot:7769416-Pyramimonas_sp.AAC.1
MLSCVIDHPVTPHSDCSGAVKLHNANRREQLCPKQMFAGLRRLAIESDPQGCLGLASYTPAHRSEE